MKIDAVEFIKSAVYKEDYPIDNLPEIVLSGRSNVGKSSFINTFLNRKNIAYISSQPGKTQTLNFYKVNEQFYFVDVPGYGYAKVSKSERVRFGQMIEEYLLNREQLRLVIQLIDFRHLPSEDDILMYDYLKSYNIPCIIIATKNDKIPKTKRLKQERLIKQHLNLDENDILIPYSSVSKENLDTIYKIIEEIL